MRWTHLVLALSFASLPACGSDTPRDAGDAGDGGGDQGGQDGGAQAGAEGSGNAEGGGSDAEGDQEGTDEEPPNEGGDEGASEFSPGEGAEGGEGDEGGEGGQPADCPEPGPVPPPVAEQIGIYDAERRQVVMVGGDIGKPDDQCRPDPQGAGETWIFDTRCRVFKKIGGVGNGPGIRARGLAVLDTKRDRMVLFGGRSQIEPGGLDYIVTNDLWNLDLETRAWGSMRSRGFPPSARHSMAGGYDSVNDRMIIHGGNTSDYWIQYSKIGGTYALDFETQTWEFIEDAGSDVGPGARLNHAGAVDSEGQKLYIYGGSTDFFDPALGDLWALDFGTLEWTELAKDSPTRPGTRFMASTMFDPVAKKLFLFGGHDSTDVGNQNDTWSYDPATDEWENITPASVSNQRPPGGNCPDFPVDFVLPRTDVPERRSAHLSAFDSRRGEWLLFGGKTDCGIINDVWSFDPRRLSWTELFTATKGESCNRRDDVVQCVAMCQQGAG